MLYILLALIAAFGLFSLARWFVTAPIEQVKRLLWFILLCILLILSIVFLKFGGVVLAALALAIPLIRKLYTMFSAYKFLRSMRKPHNNPTPSGESMNEKEAREILGVSPDATEAEIKNAYHTLMQRNHPDQGGSEYFAKKLNQARDILLRGRHNR